MAEIRSGVFGDPAARANYRAEWLGDVLIERVVWALPAEPHRLGNTIIVGEDYVWFRFWLRHVGAVVERYFAPDGTQAGTRIRVCTLPVCDGAGCRVEDLLLFLWLAPDGQVTVHNEDAFEQVSREGQLAGELVRFAETQVRQLTAAVARGKFPPSLIRNWQIDPRLIGEDKHQA